MQGYTIVQPIGEGTSNDQELLEHSSNSASNAWGAVLAHEHGRNTGHSTNSQASYDTATIDLSNVMLRSNLNSGSDKKYDGEDHQCIASANALVKGGSEDGAEEAARGQQGHDIG